MNRKSFNGNENSKRSRLRLEPYKKWNDAEQNALVEYLKNNKPIEQPNAQSYYNQFLTSQRSSRHWRVVRCKVRNMRDSYLKARNWLTTKKKDERNSDPTKEQLNIMCPYYYDFDDLFASYTGRESRSFLETPQPIIQSSYSLDSSNLSLRPLTSRNIDKKPREFVSSDSHATDYNSQLSMLLIEKKNLALRKQNLLNDMEHLENEMKIRELEIESQERVKMSEIEMNERLGLKELEMKERLEMEKIKLGQNSMADCKSS